MFPTRRQLRQLVVALVAFLTGGGSSLISASSFLLLPHRQSRTLPPLLPHQRFSWQDHSKKFGSLYYFATTAIASSADGNNQNYSTNNKYSNNEGEEDESERLRRAAEKLRKEIAEFQQQKELAQRQEELAQQEILQKVETERLRYSAILPIAKPDGSEVMERIFFRPRWTASVGSTSSSSSSNSLIVTCEIESLPLGVLLGEHSQVVGAIAVDEILQEDGFGARAGLQVGDLVRASTACRVEMDRPTWQLLVGGIGRPKTRRYMYDVDGRPLEEVLEAIRSNRLDPVQRPILLVVERFFDDESPKPDQ